MDELKKDARFAHIPKDPRFRPASKKERKLKIDRRFSSMFKDPKFKLKYTVDKRGRPLLEERTTRDDMKKFYHLDDEDQSSSTSSDDDEEMNNKKKKTIVTGDEELDEILQSDDTDEDDENDQEKSGEDDEEEGEGEDKDDQSSSSEDEDIDEVNDDGIEWNDFDDKCVRSEDMSRRLAVCNMDWDRVRAADVFVLLNSWKPADGVIKSVTIYPSEYGLKQMAIEKQQGPLPGTAKPVESDVQNGNDSGHQSDAEEEPELPEVKSDDEEELNLQNFNQEDDPDITDPVMRERIRKYQLNRLKYYYAVVECDTVQTAARIYEECDGLEYETSAVRLDLRFIPDSTSFDESIVHDRCTELPEKSVYKPVLFRNTALTQTKVRCTWDETPLDRRLLMRKKFTVEEIEKLDLDAYLASESEDEANDDDDNDNDITSDIEDDEETKAEKIDQNGTFKVPEVPDEKKSTKTRPIMKAPSVLSSQDDIERYRALLLGFDDDSDSKNKKKTKKKITNFFDDEKASDEDDDDRIPRRTQPDDDDDDDDPSDVDMEITWQPGLKSKDDDKAQKQSDKKQKNKKDKKSSRDIEEDDDDDEDDIDESESNEKPNQDSLALLTVDDDNETKRDYNLRQMIKAHKQAAKAEAKKKRKSKKSQGNFVDSISEKSSSDQFQLNVDDQRFSAVYNQAAFNIDQSDPHFKATAGTQRIIEEKLKKRKFDQINGPSTIQKEHDDLVAKLKRKSARKD